VNIDFNMNLSHVNVIQLIAGQVHFHDRPIAAIEFLFSYFFLRRQFATKGRVLPRLF
jgi:hypothetical protein